MRIRYFAWIKDITNKDDDIIDINHPKNIKELKKWSWIDTLIIHRYGKLNVNEKIVLVSCFSQHRKDSFNACEFIMDYLKKDAPFWKNEFYFKDDEWLENSK